MEPKKKIGPKKTRRVKKMDLRKKIQKNKSTKKNIIFLWFKLITRAPGLSINNNIKKRPA